MYRLLHSLHCQLYLHFTFARFDGTERQQFLLEATTTHLELTKGIYIDTASRIIKLKTQIRDSSTKLPSAICQKAAFFTNIANLQRWTIT